MTIDSTIEPPRDAGRPSATGADGPRLCGLDRLGNGRQGTVFALHGPREECRRLQELGLVAGTAVSVERVAPLGDPIVIELRGYRLSLRRRQAAMVEVAAGDAELAPTPTAAAALPTSARHLGTDGAPSIAVVGNPNSGKTSVFNAITGLRQRVGNYPGVTVDKHIGRAPIGAVEAELVDLPGTYSLTPVSPDERIATEALAGVLPGSRRPDAVLLVLDATTLERSLLLASQVLELGLPTVVAVTMNDLAARAGRPVDAPALEAALGVPVVAVHAMKGTGLLALRRALTAPAVVTGELPWHLDGPLGEATAEVAELLPAGESYAGDRCRLALARHLLLGDSLLEGHLDFPDLVDVVRAQRARLERAEVDAQAADLAARYAWSEGVAAACVAAPTGDIRPSWSRRIDGVALHRVLGLLGFGAVMWALFTTIFVVADPLMGYTEDGITALGGLVAGWLPAGPLQDLWADGIVAGVGGVLVFIPQIALLFLLLGALEQCGYLARGAVLLDRLLGWVGLHGRSFVPLLSSHACAIPGIMSARTIESPRERLLTMLVAPFMACAARLPVYGLLIGLLFAAQPAWVRGSLWFGLYALGIVVALVSAAVLRGRMRRQGQSSFTIELPSYRWPSPSQVARTVWTNSMHFVRKAGSVILVFSVLLWASLYYPRSDAAARERIAADHGVTLVQVDEAGDDVIAARDAIAAHQVRHSVAGSFGRAVEPLIQPMGFDWKMGVGLVGAFAAREVFVSTMGIVYGVGEVEDDDTPLRSAMTADTKADGAPLWTPLVAISLLVWFAIAFQCISTFGVMLRETKGWRWPVFQLVAMNALAYVLCLLVYQIGSRL